MELQNDLLLRVARGEKTERTPVWLMRQAGRILPEYRAVRNKLSGFIELAQTPELAAEVTIQPVDLLEVDAAIIFSDILVIPEAMGLPYEMIEKRGPHFPETVKTQKDVEKLRVADPEESLSYVTKAIEIVKKELNGRVPLIGFAGAPWTIFAYMVEGGGSKTFSRAKEMLYTQPELSHQLMQMITDSTIAYLKAQVKSGADLIQVFDSWAGILSPRMYAEFAIPYINQIGEAIEEVPKTIFAKGAFFTIEEFSKSTYNTIGLDWNTKPSFAKSQLANNKVFQGNLDPCALYSDNEILIKLTREMLDEFGPYHHIANLGHGVYPDINPDKVKVFINEVKEYSSKMRS